MPEPPNPPAPPAPTPTPTMAESIARLEARAAERERTAEQFHGDTRTAILTNVADLRAALSAMRAVEAGPVAFALKHPRGYFNPDVLCATQDEARKREDGFDEDWDEEFTYEIVGLYAFPSPDGGSAT